MNPLVSVVIPAYNAEKWIGEAIHSVVLRQTYHNIEFIIVDDASTDGTVEIIREIFHPKVYYHGIELVTLVRCHENEGECRTSRKGFAIARGKYITRLSADDFYVPIDHIENQVKIMESTGKDWCYNSRNLSGKQLSEADIIQTSWVPALPQLDNLILKFPKIAFLIMLFRFPVWSNTLMIRNVSYQKYAQWSNNHRTDCDGHLLLHLLLNGARGTAIRKIGAFYRIHEAQGINNPQFNARVKEIRQEAAQEVIAGEYPLWFKTATKLVMRWKYGS